MKKGGGEEVHIEGRKEGREEKETEIREIFGWSKKTQKGEKGLE